MRDFPMFTTQNGVASLIFREVPYRGVAYIQIHSSENPDSLLGECVDFATAVGAEQIFATGHEFREKYPFHTAIVCLSAEKSAIAPGAASLFPVTRETLEGFREIYNRKMEKVPNSAYMTQTLAKEMLQKGEGYFVHHGGALLGIGMISGCEIKALASCCPNAGGEILRTLCGAVFEDTVTLECASENKKAMALYAREGFLVTKELRHWYRVK